ncbi:MAG: hypothetical protein ACRBM6_14060 [Geminicoccales bacterium]
MSSLGVTVMPEWIQSEGVDQVLDNLERAGVDAVATSPYVMAESDADNAGREPPIDAGAGKVRLLDRPLWGKRELRCLTAPSYEPDFSHYQNLTYQPSEPTDLTRREGPKVAAFLEAARARGFDVQLQVQAAIPPGYRVQFGGPLEADMPRLPDGSIHNNRVDKNGSLASPAIVDYTTALIRDVAAAYPMIDALRIDWPEYPPYDFKAWFFDFSDHAVQAAVEHGYDVEAMRRDCLVLMADPSQFINEGFDALPGFVALQTFKADLTLDLIKSCRAALPSSMRLVVHAFPPPWSHLSGMDFARVADAADDIAVKLYTMHWPMMLQNYRRHFTDRGVPEDDATEGLLKLFDTGGGSAFHYPEPDEAHPASAEAQARKIGAARTIIAGKANLIPSAHAYGSTDDVLSRIAIALAAGETQAWINRYGYLSDDKLAGLGRLLETG